MKEVEWNNLNTWGTKHCHCSIMGLNIEAQTPVGRTRPYSYKDKNHLFKVSNVKIMDGVLDWDEMSHSILK